MLFPELLDNRSDLAPSPDRKPPPQLRPDPLDAATRARAEAALSRMRKVWKRSYDYRHDPPRERELGTMPMCWGPITRFANEAISGETALRLFALGYPEVAESWAAKVAPDPGSPPWERPPAIRLLGHLASAMGGAPESVLMRLCRDADGETHLLAEEVLVKADPEGSHRELYRELARAGDAPAAEALSFWRDPEAITILEDGPAWVFHPYHGRPVDPRNALTRLKAFEGGTWEGMVKEAIVGQLPLLSAHFTWAVRVGLERRPAWFGAALRERMGTEYASGRFRFLKDHQAYVDSVVVDDLLVALSEIGGPLSEDEQQYLRNYGYLGEPRQRLDEWLDRWGRE
jgi:hypothetical protein